MQEPSLYITILAALLAVLFVLKTYILFQASRHVNTRRWFYFRLQEIIEAPTVPVARLRKLQNRLTIAFFIATALILLLIYLFAK